MKTLFNIILITFSFMSWAQSMETKISNVENGFILQTTIPVGSEITQAHITEKMKDHKINGASIAVIHSGKLDWSKSYGVLEAKGKKPVTNQTLFQCASIGKIISTVAVMQLVKQGKLDLDENVNNKLNRWKITENKHTESQKVTLRHLLSHSSGLSDDYGFLGYAPGDEIPTLVQILNNEVPAKTKKSLEIMTVPGKVERYSGGGYLIIQLLVEEASQMSFEQYVEQNVFLPLQMLNTTYSNQPDKNMTIASGHTSNGKPLKNKKYHIYPEKAAAGPWTTAEDLAKLILEIQNTYNGESELLLNETLVSEILTPQINNKGLGVNLKGIHKPQAFWHAGQNLGYMGLIYGLIENGDGAIILINSDGGELFVKEFMSSVANAYNWPVMKSFQSLEIPEDLQSQLKGNYQSLDGLENLSIEHGKNGLAVKSPNSKKSYELYRIGENHYTFKNSQDYFKLSFKITDNNTTSLLYEEHIGKIVEMNKVVTTIR